MAQGSSREDDQEIRRREGTGPAPLSYGQELLWLMDRATPGLTAWNVPRALRLRGALDVPALQRALDALVERHEVLRTVFRGAEGSAQQIVQLSAGVPMPVVDLSSLSSDERAAEADRIASAHAGRAFDLANDLLLQATLIKLGDDEHILCLNSHHIVSDGWSRSVMFRELSALYGAFHRGGNAALPPLPIQFADYATWERSEAHDRSLAESLAYWREQFAGSPPELALPTDYSPAGVPGFAGAVRMLTLPLDLVQSLNALAQDNDVTFYMVMLAAYTAVLHRYSGQDDIIVGSPIAGRTQSETEELIGYFANTMVLRTSVHGDPSFAELLERVRETALGAYEHHDVPLDQLFLEIQQREKLRHAPLFRVVLTMEETIPQALELGDIKVENIDAEEGSTKFDLTLLFSTQPDGMRLRLAYRTDLFSDGYAERFLAHMRALLEGAVAAPDTRVSRLPMLTAGERAELAGWNETAAGEGKPATIVSLFETQAERNGERSAVVAPRPNATSQGSVAGTLVLTYAELNARANQLARQLKALGVGRNAPVGLLLDRSVDAIVGLVGILKAGGAYMPLSVDAPPARIAQQVNESGTRVVITNVSLAERAPASAHVIALDSDADATRLGAQAQTNPDSDVAPEDLAYVLYTSGSTGTPKGVAVTHANAVHYARAIGRVLGDDLDALDGWQFGMASTLAADLGNTSLLPSLMGGGTLHVLGKDVTTEPERFAQYLSVHALDVLKVTPNHMLALAAGKVTGELAGVLPRKWLIMGGEALRPEVGSVFLGAAKCRVLNHYGPTETTVGVLTNEVTLASIEAAAALGAQTVPLGRPLANTQAFVVNAAGEEQPLGVPGELWLGGAGVTEGYLKRDDLTAQRFTTFRGARVYHTGDRVRRLADGTIEFLGRTDDQVKVRGYRVELGEVEQVLRGHPGVEHAVVVLLDVAGESQLVAYAVPKQAGYAVSHSDRPTTEKLSEYMSVQLPEYMVPRAIVLLDSLPLTANGKVDKRALPAPDAQYGNAEASYIAPRTQTEIIVARIWGDVLKREQVGVTDSFLDLGGHSLLAIRVLGRISKELGVRLALRTLFETPTVERVAAIIDAERAQKAEEEALRQALAAVDGMSDAEVTQLLDADSAGKGS